MAVALAFTHLVGSAGDHGHWWIVASFFWALWLVVLGSVLFLVFRRRSCWRGWNRAEAILAERFARGEISTEEFRERQDALR